jgi:hypothetical protein
VRNENSSSECCDLLRGLDGDKSLISNIIFSFSISRSLECIDLDGALRSVFLAKTDGSGICPTGFNVPTEAHLKAETDI